MPDGIPFFWMVVCMHACFVHSAHSCMHDTDVAVELIDTRCTRIELKELKLHHLMQTFIKLTPLQRFSAVL
jgi:hypothetical protein